MRTDETTESAASTLNGSSPAVSAPAKKPKKRGGTSLAPKASKAKAAGKGKPRKAKAGKASRKAPRKASKVRSASGQAKIAKGKTYALVARLGADVYRKAWAKVEKLDKARKPGQERVSMSSWLVSVIAKAAK